MDDDYIDIYTFVCGECWDIVINENSDKFILMAESK